jgi:hypothetical protein
MPSNTLLLAGAAGVAWMLGGSINHHLLDDEDVDVVVSMLQGGREADEEMAAIYGTYQLSMLTGQTALDDPQNGRYPDMDPVTLVPLSEQKAI